MFYYLFQVSGLGLGLGAVRPFRLCAWLLMFLACTCHADPGLDLPAQQVNGDSQTLSQGIHLSSQQIQKSGIRLNTALAGQLAINLTLPGQVMINTDKLVQVLPRVAGVVREVRKSLGDKVKAGTVLAVIDSRELADARAAYLAAKERSALALTTFQRKQNLLESAIISQQVFQEAKQLLAVAKIEQQSAEQKLLTLGISKQDLQNLSRHSADSADLFSRYEISAPFAGTILERHITLGGAVEANLPIFQIGDLNTVWVDLQVYPKDLALLRSGQSVTVTVSGANLKAQGNIIHIQPLISQDTQRTFARVALDNRDGRWQPGLFVQGVVQTGVVGVPVCITRSALQTIAGETVVFVKTAAGFEQRPVSVGRSDDNQVEITAGLNVGESYAETGGFILKSELQKGADDND